MELSTLEVEPNDVSLKETRENYWYQKSYASLANFLIWVVADHCLFASLHSTD